MVPVRYLTARDTLMNIDSPAVWHGPDGSDWLLVTAKEGDVIRVHEAATGVHIRDVGGPGTALGQFQRPNGVAVSDSLLFVVERDNARIQVLTLPGFAPLGAFGSPELQLPYGISLHRTATGDYRVFITDNYEFEADVVPPDSLLGERVREYRVNLDAGGLRADLVRNFGETSGPGVLKVVESLLGDPELGRLLVAEELEGASHLKVYDLEGNFTGQLVGEGRFPHQAEGIVLYACHGGAGYWIATDQGLEVNTFQVFDRATLTHVGSFRAEGVLNTDGIALTQRALPGFAAGAFFAVHDDGNVAALSWAEIAAATGLRADCVIP